MKGGSGAADWVIGSAGNMSQQTGSHGSSGILQYKPVSCGGGKRRGTRSKKGGLLLNRMDIPRLSVPQAYIVISQSTRKLYKPKKKNNKSKRRH